MLSMTANKGFKKENITIGLKTSTPTNQLNKMCLRPLFRTL